MRWEKPTAIGFLSVIISFTTYAVFKTLNGIYLVAGMLALSVIGLACYGLFKGHQK